MSIVRLSQRMLTVLCAAALVLVTVRGVMDPLFCFDPFQYHLPFAAYLWNIGNAQELVGSIAYSARYHGFGLAANWWQGYFWWLFDSANFVPLANIFPYVGTILLAWKWFRVSPPFLVFVTLAMPMIAIHLTSAYIDLFVAAMQMLVVMAGIRLSLLYDHGGTRKQKIIACLVLAFGAIMAGNSKHSAYGPLLGILILIFIKIHKPSRFLFSLPLAIMSLPLLIWVAVKAGLYVNQTLLIAGAFFVIHFALLLAGLFRRNMPRWVLLFILLVAVASAATMIKNTVIFKNPFWPLRNPYYTSGLTFGQPLASYYSNESSHFFHYTLAEGARDFLLSLVEYDMLFNIPEHFFYSEASQRANKWQGGLYGPLIVVLLTMTIAGCSYLFIRRRMPDEIIHALHFLLLLTGVYMMMIQSVQLRYCLAWAFTLALLCGMLLRHVFRRGSLWSEAMVWISLAVLVWGQLYLPLQRRLYDLKWVSYYPGDIIDRLDPEIFETFRRTGLGCFPRVKIPLEYDGFGVCAPSVLIYSPIFTRQNYKYYWVTNEQECDTLIK